MDMNTDETTIDHSGTFGTVTNPATQYHSHAKISGRAKKGSVEHIANHQMSAAIPDQYDVFPGVKGAERHATKKTF